MNSKALNRFKTIKLPITYLLLLTILCCISIPTRAEITTTYSINSSTMDKIKEWVDKDTIVFINLDDTIMTPKSLMFSYDSNPFRQFIDNLVELGKTRPRYNSAVVKWYQDRKLKLVEDGWPAYINDIRKKALAVYGMCKMPLHIVNIEEKRYLETKELGIDFTNQVNNQEFLEIKKEESWFAKFHKGIIFTGPYSMTHILLEFLKVTNNVPKKILFITNRKPDVKRVDKALRVYRMKFYNVAYLTLYTAKGKPDANLVQFQQKQLIDRNIWMEDDVAKNALEEYTKR